MRTADNLHRERLAYRRATTRFNLKNRGVRDATVSRSTSNTQSQVSLKMTTNTAITTTNDYALPRTQEGERTFKDSTSCSVPYEQH